MFDAEDSQKPHIAQLNIGRTRYDLEDPRIADFVNNLDRVNALAERSPGFVWRLKDDANNATAFRFPGDGETLVNMSVWESAEALEHYVWNTVHKQFYRRKGEWFQPMGENHFVMWPIKPGHLPTLEEAAERLDHLNKHGSTDFAFGWDHLPHLKAWVGQQCA
ncbi:MAG: DUF3291 domain-containing protein [Pseudomonadota bacterium]